MSFNPFSYLCEVQIQTMRLGCDLAVQGARIQKAKTSALYELTRLSLAKDEPPQQQTKIVVSKDAVYKADFDALAKEVAENEGMSMAISSAPVTAAVPSARTQMSVKYQDLLARSKCRVPDTYSKAPAALRLIEEHQKSKKQKPGKRDDMPSAVRVLERHRKRAAAPAVELDRQEEFEGVALLGAD